MRLNFFKRKQSTKIPLTEKEQMERDYWHWELKVRIIKILIKIGVIIAIIYILFNLK